MKTDRIGKMKEKRKEKKQMKKKIENQESNTMKKFNEKQKSWKKGNY